MVGVIWQWGDVFVVVYCWCIVLFGYYVMQYIGQLVGLGIVQVDYVQVVGFILGVVQFFYQLLCQVGVIGVV